MTSLIKKINIFCLFVLFLTITSFSGILIFNNENKINLNAATQYTVRFDQQGGTGGTTSVVVNDGEYLPEIIAPTKSGYIFGGYYLGKNGTGMCYYTYYGETPRPRTVDVSRVLYAHWVENSKAHTITFDKQGGTGGADGIISALGLNMLQIGGAPTKTGYLFGGYFSNKDAQGKAYYSPREAYPIGNDDFTSDTTLYASWIPESWTYSIQFKLDENTEPVKFDWSTNIEFGTYTGLWPQNNLKKEGYYLSGVTSDNVGPWACGIRSGGGNYFIWDGSEFDYIDEREYIFISLGKYDGDTVTITGHWMPKSYSVTYDANGGEGSETSQNIRYNDLVTFKTGENLSKIGHTLVSWNTEADGSGTTYELGQYFSKYNIAENLILYAQWEAQEYTVTLDTKGGEITQNTMLATFGEPYGTILNPTRNGYDFVGWYKEESFTNLVTKDTIVSATSNHTLYAKWTPKTFNISYQIESGATIESGNPLTYTVSDTNQELTLLNPSYSGFSFIGWGITCNTTPSSSINQGKLIIPVNAYGNIELTANFEEVKLKVSFKINIENIAELTKNEITNIPYESTIIVNNNSITINGETVTARAKNILGYNITFVGWTNIENIIITEDRTIIANFTSEAKTYKITYNPNGGTGSEIEQIVTFDEDITLSSGTNLIRDNYDLINWNTQANGSGMQYELGYEFNPYNIAENLILYAQWNPHKFIVTLDVKGGEITNNQMQVIFDEPYGIIESPSRPGFEFSGWYLEESYTNLVTKDSIVKASGNHTLYAKWTGKTYNISYELENDVSNDNQTTYKTSESEQEITLLDPLYTGYTFTGWSIISNTTPASTIVEGKLTIPANAYGNIKLSADFEINKFTVNFVVNNDRLASLTKDKIENVPYGSIIQVNGRSIIIINITVTALEKSLPGYTLTFDGWTNTDNTITEDITITANFSSEAKTYKITYNSNGGIGSENEQIATYDQDITLSNGANLIKENYNLLNWNTQANGTGTTYNLGETFAPFNLTENLELFAQWGAHKYTVTLDAKGGEVTQNTMQVTFNEPYGTIPMPTRNGYEFAGWYLEESYTNLVTKITIVNVIGNHTLYAKWVANTYIISYVLESGATNGSGNSTSYIVTDDIQELIIVDPLFTGYTFNGWAITSNTTPASTIAEGKLTIPENAYGNIELTAEFTLKSFSINYELNGGIVDGTNPNLYYYNTNDQIEPLIEPVKTGYNFIGWIVKTSNCYVSLNNLTIPAGLQENIILSANFSIKTFLIQFDINNSLLGSLNKNQLEAVPYGSEIIVDENTLTINNTLIIASKSYLGGYEITFKDWTNTEGLIVSERVITANFEKLPLTYDILRNTDNGNSLSNLSFTTSDSTQYFELENPTKTGYTFDKWIIVANTMGYEATISNNVLTIPASAYGLIQVKATWIANKYNVIFIVKTKDNKGNEIVGSPEINPQYTILTYDQAYGNLPTPKLKGYIFKGWFLEDTFENQITKDTILSISGEHKLFAKWEEEILFFETTAGIAVIASAGGIILILLIVIPIIRAKRRRGAPKMRFNIKK